MGRPSCRGVVFADHQARRTHVAVRRHLEVGRRRLVLVRAAGTVEGRAVAWAEEAPLPVVPDAGVDGSRGHRRGRAAQVRADAHRVQAAQALQYLHGSSPQVLHRDLKPDNLLLSEHGRRGDIRIADFGLTKLASACLRTHS
ncbi:MAG: protein kinase [Rhizobiales bacterium]|nr:protein kinase [Hyphomicrobiales bacterium]